MGLEWVSVWALESAQEPALGLETGYWLHFRHTQRVVCKLDQP